MISRQIIESFDPDMVISIAHYPEGIRRKSTILRQVAQMLKKQDHLVLWDHGAHILYIKYTDYVKPPRAKFCVECRFCKKHKFTVNLKCHRSCKKLPPNLVTGECKYIELRDCLTERYDVNCSDACGKTGKYFKSLTPVADLRAEMADDETELNLSDMEAEWGGPS